MTQQYGYAGEVLRVDLSSGSTAKIMTSDYAERFLGGRGIAAKIYWDEVSPETRAFDEGNRLIFALGPLAGIPLLGGSRWGVFGKSPLSASEKFCYGNLGGRWGVGLKFAGYDGLVIQGKSDKPVYLLIHDNNVEIKDASSLWGKGARETLDILKKELGKEARVVSIGPAGENRVTTATLLADGDASGSGGLGAVMGSKETQGRRCQGRQEGDQDGRTGKAARNHGLHTGVGQGKCPGVGDGLHGPGGKKQEGPLLWVPGELRESQLRSR